MNELKRLLQEWVVRDELLVFKELILEYVDVYELIRKKAVLSKVDGMVCDVLYDFYKHLNTYTEEIDTMPFVKKQNTLSGVVTLQSLLLRLEEIRNELYVLNHDPILDDSLLEIFSVICQSTGVDVYDAFFKQ